jgi:tetraacyldisaccharide 4'-kinase
MMLKPATVEASWYGRDRLGWFWRCCLLVLSWLYELIVCLRRELYKKGMLQQTRLPVPVLVVGNLIVGGAGKTPVARALARQLKGMGWRPGIVSRGYGRKVPGVRAVGPEDSPHDVGDEPLLYAQDGFPVYVGEQRAAAGQALLRANPDINILIADDGLQHLALARDLEVIVFDQRGAGNGQLLPAGPLREPLSRISSGSVRGLIVQGHPDQQGWPKAPQFEMTLIPESVYRLNQPSHTRLLEDFAGQSVVALAGMGHPERFFTMLRAYGLHVDGHAFQDHHAFQAKDIPMTDLPVLMTAKDAVKCKSFAVGHDNWYVVPVCASFSPELPLGDWLQGIDTALAMENR